MGFEKFLEPAINVFNDKARKETKSLNDANGTVIDIDDENAIRQLCRAVFPASGQLPSSSTIHDFNTILVQVAEQFIVKPNLDQILNVIATTKQVDKNTSLVEFTVEKDYNIKFSMVAGGSGHKLVKIGDNRKIAQVPYKIGFGVTYDPLTKTDDEIEWYRRAVKEIGRAKIARIYGDCLKLLSAAGNLPAKNVVEGANLTYAQYRDLAAVMRRRTGGRPTLLGDALLLDNIATKMAEKYTGSMLWDGIKQELFGEYAPTNLGTFDGMAYENKFIDDLNTKVELPVNEGIMFSASSRFKPLAVTQIGTMVQKTNTEIKDDKVEMWVEQELAITLLYPQYIGRTKDTALSL